MIDVNDDPVPGFERERQALEAAAVERVQRQAGKGQAADDGAEWEVPFLEGQDLLLVDVQTRLDAELGEQV